MEKKLPSGWGRSVVNGREIISSPSNNGEESQLNKAIRTIPEASNEQKKKLIKRALFNRKIKKVTLPDIDIEGE